MAPTWSDMEKMSEAELIQAYDQTTHNTQLWLDDYRQMIVLKRQERLDRTIANYTRQVLYLTYVITVLTVINIAVTLLSRH